MATENQIIKTTIQALEDLNTHQYQAFAINDGKVANNVQEASGILLGKPKNKEFAEIGYIGEMKFRAGGAIAAGGKITVTTSGYFTSAGSNEANIGTCKLAVTSGSVGTGFFDFTRAAYPMNVIYHSVTAADAIPAGRAYALNDNKLANNGAEADGLAISTIASGSTGLIVLSGVGAATLANSYGAGHRVVATTSGYWTTAVSGFAHNGVVTTAALSGQTGAIFFGSAHGVTLA